MFTSHKFPRLLIALFALATLAIAALAGDNPVNVGVSDQKAGAMLVFPYYTNVGQSDTRITITNVGAGSAQTAAVHIILLDKSCQQLDYYACITPNGSLIDKASSFDPTNSGYIIALNVNPTSGRTLNRNWLIGNAFVNDGDYVGNYGAEAFWAGSELVAAPVLDLPKNDIEALGLVVPCEFAIEIQSPKDAVQRVITVGLRGDVSASLTGAALTAVGGALNGSAQVGTGFAFNAQENGGSFQRFLTGVCFSDATITNTNPRVPTTLGTLISSGNAGHLRFSVGAAVGLIMTGKSSASGLSGIRTLHKTKVTGAVLAVPAFMPAC